MSKNRKLANLINEMLKEYVPFTKFAEVHAGLSSKYKDLDSGTFGVEFEFTPAIEFTPEILDSLRKDLADTMSENASLLQKFNQWRESKSSEINKGQKQWNDKYGPPDRNDFDAMFPAPDESKYKSISDFARVEDEWKTARRKASYAYQRYDNQFPKWDLAYEYLTTLPESQIVDYGKTGDALFKAGKRKWTNILHQLGEKVAVKTNKASDEWGIVPDAGVEIQSKYLTLADFPVLMQVIEKLNAEKTNKNQSAHVHIGVGDDFDYFDAIACSKLVDEKSVESAVGNRDWSFTNLRPVAEKDIMNIFFEEIGFPEKDTTVELDQTQLSQFLTRIDRYKGTNIKSIIHRRTIEFRYFASTIKKKPKAFLAWIRYFLIIPKIAASRNRFKLSNGYQTLMFTRLEGGKARVDFVKGKETPTVSTGVLPAADRKKEKLTKFQQIKKNKGVEDRMRDYNRSPDK